MHGNRAVCSFRFGLFITQYMYIILVVVIWFSSSFYRGSCCVERTPPVAMKKTAVSFRADN